MSAPSIALNRFGYGALFGAANSGAPAPQAGSDPVRYLRRQIDRFDPAPKMIANRPSTSGQAGALLSAIRSARRASRKQDGMQADADAMRKAYKNTIRQSKALFRSDVAIRFKTAVLSDTPLAERLVHFWANHFAVSVRKRGTQFEAGDLEFNAIRPHVFGTFSDMLKSASLHPGMLLYLDQLESVGPNSPSQTRRRRKKGLNENLAREILELHTLGAGGGYSQDDVTEFARALTGWTIPGIDRLERYSEAQNNGAAFVAPAHEPGARRIMGRNYKAGGADQALQVLDDLAAHPSTARFIATKLARHFAGGAPAPSLVDRLAADFTRTNGDLASLTRTLIDAPEVWTNDPVRYRQPFEWLVASFRMTGAPKISDGRIFGALRELGQLPWQPPSPAGYDDADGSWAGPDAVFRRVEMAERIARGADGSDVMKRAAYAFPGALSDTTQLWLSRAESGEQALALLLVSPEMMRR